MNTSYSPETDEELMTACGFPDNEGNLLHIDETLYYSRGVGFYIMLRKGQIQKDGEWNNVLMGDFNDHIEWEECTAHKRIITVFRPMTPQQTLIWILNSSLPIGSNAKEILMSACSIKF